MENKILDRINKLSEEFDKCIQLKKQAETRIIEIKASIMELKKLLDSMQEDKKD